MTLTLPSNVSPLVGYALGISYIVGAIFVGDPQNEEPKDQILESFKAATVFIITAIALTQFLDHPYAPLMTVGLSAFAFAAWKGRFLPEPLLTFARAHCNMIQAINALALIFFNVVNILQTNSENVLQISRRPINA